MLVVWGRRTSSNVQAVLWCLAELGLHVEQHDIGHRYGGNNTAAFLAMNPNGSVPVLQDGEDEPIWESAAILRYLASRYAKTPFWPAEPGTRAQIDKWAEWAKLNIAVPFTNPIFWQVVRTPAHRRNETAVSQALATLTVKLLIAEEQLQRQAFLASEHMSLADIAFGTILYRYFDVAIARPNLPALRRYYERLTDRPAYRAHVMLSYDDLRAS